VKAHSGILLNECADQLATKGVNLSVRPFDEEGDAELVRMRMVAIGEAQ
jgi:ribonuclease HI